MNFVRSHSIVSTAGYIFLSSFVRTIFRYYFLEIKGMPTKRRTSEEGLVEKILTDTVYLNSNGRFEASKAGYAAALYVLLPLRSKSLRWKGRCIPRLELRAVVLLSDLDLFICNTHNNISFDWVLQGCNLVRVPYNLSFSPHRWKIIVVNRANSIQEIFSRNVGIMNIQLI